jgi:hypothetical protein
VASLSICKFVAVLHVNAARAQAFPIGVPGSIFKVPNSSESQLSVLLASQKLYGG